MKPRIMRASSRPTSKAEAANFVGSVLSDPLLATGRACRSLARLARLLHAGAAAPTGTSMPSARSSTCCRVWAVTSSRANRCRRSSRATPSSFRPTRGISTAHARDTMMCYLAMSETDEKGNATTWSPSRSATPTTPRRRRRTRLQTNARPAVKRIVALPSSRLQGFTRFGSESRHAQHGTQPEPGKIDDDHHDHAQKPFDGRVDGWMLRCNGVRGHERYEGEISLGFMTSAAMPVCACTRGNRAASLVRAAGEGSGRDRVGEPHEIDRGNQGHGGDRERQREQDGRLYAPAALTAGPQSECQIPAAPQEVSQAAGEALALCRCGDQGCDGRAKHPSSMIAATVNRPAFLHVDLHAAKYQGGFAKVPAIEQAK